MAVYSTRQTNVKPKDDLKQFAYSRSWALMEGLSSVVGLQAGKHYMPHGHNSSRAIMLVLHQSQARYLSLIRKNLTEIGMHAGLSDSDSGLRLGFTGLSIHIEMAKPERFWTPVDVGTLKSRRYLRRGPVATLGMGLQDQPIRIDWKSGDAGHVLIAGSTRCGKTNTQRVIVYNLVNGNTPDEIQLIILDVAKRGYNWHDFNSDHLAHPLVDDRHAAASVMRYLVKEIDRRATERTRLPHLFVIVDELAALIEDVEGSGELLAKIARIGAEFGVFLILATQHPQIKMLGNADLKRNLVTRLVGRTDDRVASENAIGLPSSQAERLTGKGDFLLRTPDNTVSRFTVANLTTDHVQSLPSGKPGQLDLPPVDERQELGSGLIMTPEQMGQALAVWPDSSGVALGQAKMQQMFGGGRTVNQMRQVAMVKLAKALQDKAPAGHVIDPHNLATKIQGRRE